MINSFIEQLNLLYVEDEEVTRGLLSKRLERMVNKLYIAEDGNDGYEKYLEFKPDLILTDVTMPKLNGIEMSKKIREIDSEIPIIVLSAHSDSSSLLEAIESGITGYLLKPINKEKLYALLESNAKTIYLDKINIKQQKQIEEQKILLQNIMNTDKNITIVTDFKDIPLVNNSFLEFFNISSLEEFKIRFKRIEDIFIDYTGYIHKELITEYEDINYKDFSKRFYTMLNEIDDTKKLVLMLDQHLELKSFYINISILNEDKNLYLISLTDITQMTIAKNDTEYKAYYDGLTKIYNRNKFDELFLQELLRVQRYKDDLSIAILDIDNFKNFNDTFGHLIGDEVLIMLANNLKEKVRNTDIFARWGGEEFVILFIETNLDDAIIIADKLRKYISELKHKTAGSITASFGLTKYKEGDTLESLFNRCDEALYSAKENGRNRVESK